MTRLESKLNVYEVNTDYVNAAVYKKGIDIPREDQDKMYWRLNVRSTLRHAIDEYCEELKRLKK